MIPKKNLFAGALGKLHNIGGSECFSIPHTVNVPVQYQVNSNLVGDFVICSLDGRLWCLKRSNRFYFFALKWNPDTLKLEFAASISRINETILARGLDWILTGKVLIKVLDDSPYIATFNLFSDSSVLTLQEGQNIAHCYSILPPLCEFEAVDDVPVLINEFQIVENLLIRRYSNGYMLSRLIPLEFFQTRIVQNSPLFDNDFSVSYSDNHIIAHNSGLWGAGKYALGKVFLLPAVFDSMGNVTTFYLYFQYEHKLPRSPRFLRTLIENLTVAEFNGHSFALINNPLSWEDAKYDCIARGGHLATCTSKEKNDFLTTLAGGVFVSLGATYETVQENWRWINGEEWNYTNWTAAYDDYSIADYSNYHILLLRNGEWDLAENDSRGRYICEWDSLEMYDIFLNHMNDETDSFSLAPAFLADNLHGYKFNSGHNLCSLSDDNSLLNPVSGEWSAVSEHNGNIHFDINQSKAISLDDKGANFLHDDNVRFDCNTLNQWLAPAGHVDALDDNFIVSSADNLSIVTHPDSGFAREALHNKVLPLSAPLGNGYRFSLGCSTNNSNRILVDVNQIASNTNSHQPILWNNVYKHALDLELVNVVRDIDLVYECVADIMYLPFFLGEPIHYRVLDRYSDYKTPVSSNFPRIPSDNNIYPVVLLDASVDVYYIDPVNGNVCFFDNLHATFDDYEFYSGNFFASTSTRAPKKVTHITDDITIINGKIGFWCTTYYINEDAVRNGHKPTVLRTEEFFLPLKDIPDNLKIWCIPNKLRNMNYRYYPVFQHYSSGKQGIILDSVSNSYACFHETSTNLQFALACPNVPDITQIEYYINSFACETPHINIDNDKKKFLHSIHIAGKEKGYTDLGYLYDLYVFRSTLHTDIFNFDSELQRSGIS